jgi:S-disulfanyl-L-cysteine oxidoreductase SoxD
MRATTLNQPMKRTLSSALLALSVLASGSVFAAKPWNDIGRDATKDEVAAWDIDVRPDFKGLPKGAGSVDRGTEVWESKCASCHGVFGESNEVFTPIIGGTTLQDIETGHVANLLPGKNFPQRTTIMKVATVSTLWDYINRAMPWNAPKSLSTDDVYAVLAYLLNLAEIVPADYVLSNDNIAQVQERMPNRNGMTFFKPLWDVNSKGDVVNTACMTNCASELTLGSSLPDFARDAHGNINEQNRGIGPVRGAVTTEPAPKTLEQAREKLGGPAQAPKAEGAPDVKALLTSNSCTACHGMVSKMVGPGFAEVAAKYKDKADAVDYLSAKIKNGGVGVWGGIPMPAQAQLSDADAAAIAQWIAAGAK